MGILRFEVGRSLVGKSIFYRRCKSVNGMAYVADKEGVDAVNFLIKEVSYEYSYE